MFSLRIARRAVSFLVLLGLLVGLSTAAPTPGGSARVPGADADSADIPPFGRGIVTFQNYLDERQQHILTLRGLPQDRPDLRIRALQQQAAQERRRGTRTHEVGGPWTSMGPEPIPNGQTQGSTTATIPMTGRVTAIAVHPTDPNKLYVGTAQGGVFRSLNGGANWTAIFDGAMSLAIGAIAIAPSSPTTIYVGTGEPNASSDSFFGVGLYRVDNAESTPTLVGPINPLVTTGIANTDAFTGRSISKILVHPADAATVFVGTAQGRGGLGGDTLSTLVPPLALRGLYRSTNATAAAGSVAFTKVTVSAAGSVAPDTSGNRSVADMVFEPGNPGTMLISLLGTNTANDGGIYRTTNALAATPAFAQVLSLGTATATVRSALAINKIGATVTAYAATSEYTNVFCPDDAGTVRKSVDGGQTWSVPQPNAEGFCGGQCDYNIAIALDPGNANRVLLGGQSLSACAAAMLRSTDGGSNYFYADNGLHADTHAVEFAPSNPSIAYTGSDGGIWRSADGGATWASKNSGGFNATQFQSLATHPTDPSFLIGGTQDNGTNFLQPDGTWRRADFGDGGFALIDQNATDTTNVTMYHTYFNVTNAMGFARVTNTANAFDNGETSGWTLFGCGFSGAVANGITCPATAIRFYAPMALGPGNPNTLYFGSDRLWRSTDRGATMNLASQAPILASHAITAIGIAPQNDSVRIVGLRRSTPLSFAVYRTTTGSAALDDVSAGLPQRYVARAVIDKNNANIAYLTFGGYELGAGEHVWKTTNLSASPPVWTASGNGIPDVPVNAFAIDPANSNILYAGTDIGVYRSTDAGANWVPYGTGLPRVAVFDMAFQRLGNVNPARVLRVATHGRGIWQITTAANDQPVLTLANTSISYSPLQAATLIDGSASANDADSPVLTNGSLTVDYAANGTADDRLEIRDEGSGTGQIGVSGANISFGNTLIGTQSGGTGTSPLVVTFNSSATPAAAQALVRNVTYRNVNANPSRLPRQVRFTLKDEDSGTGTATRFVAYPADLKVSAITNTTPVQVGVAATFTGTVTNTGPNRVDNAVITATNAALLSASWTCTASGGATCNTPSGSGLLSALATVPVGGTVTVTQTGTISTAAVGGVNTTFTASHQPGGIETQAADNSATLPNLLVPKIHGGPGGSPPSKPAPGGRGGPAGGAPGNHPPGR
ncbi:MAG: hypothetical protein U0821_20270 [Chloroflexota bacterium]